MKKAFWRWNLNWCLEDGLDFNRRWAKVILGRENVLSNDIEEINVNT